MKVKITADLEKVFENIHKRNERQGYLLLTLENIAQVNWKIIQSCLNGNGKFSYSEAVLNSIEYPEKCSDKKRERIACKVFQIIDRIAIYADLLNWSCPNSLKKFCEAIASGNVKFKFFERNLRYKTQIKMSGLNCNEKPKSTNKNQDFLYEIEKARRRKIYQGFRLLPKVTIPDDLISDGSDLYHARNHGEEYPELVEAVKEHLTFPERIGTSNEFTIKIPEIEKRVQQLFETVFRKKRNQNQLELFPENLKQESKQ